MTLEDRNEPLDESIYASKSAATGSARGKTVELRFLSCHLNIIFHLLIVNYKDVFSSLM